MSTVPIPVLCYLLLTSSHFQMVVLYFSSIMVVRILPLKKKKRFYLFIHRDTEREAETQAEGEAGSMQRAWRGTRSRVSRIMPWAVGSAKPLYHQGCPVYYLLYLGILLPLGQCTFTSDVPEGHVWLSDLSSLLKYWTLKTHDKNWDTLHSTETIMKA